MNLVVKHTGGIETANLYATGYDIFGNPVPEGMNITFTILDGPDGGEFVGTDASATEAIAVTNSQGIATVPIHSGTISGTIRIRAFADTVLSNATQVMVSAGPPAYIVAGVDTCNVPWWYIVNERNGVAAVVSDIYLNPVNDSTLVYFSCDEGTMKSHEVRTEELEGVAYTEWISGNNVATADGIVYVYAETAGGTVACTTFFYNSSPYFTPWAVPDAFNLQADGLSTKDVTILALDENGNFMVDGTTIDFDGGAYLSIDNATLKDGFTSCQDNIKVSSSGTLDTDNSLTGGNDDGIGRVVAIVGEAAGGGITSMFTVTLTTGTAYYENCEMSCEANVAAGTDLQVRAVIQDRWGNPLGDHTLILTASAGSVSNGTQETNTYGEAFDFTFTAPGAAGNVVLTIEDTDPRGGVVLTKSVTVE